ncbi:TetR family transcriptional regulator [Paenibacillus baekrokdamisoli]|uniref:TetR family transcriptional regulator n=1 Tax=Paenibacillus baekrokdamisoli TaxID=1712516 RepID=A0A3G9JGP4_9BACL|nr:TetR/AcrR family transcriptional regulator [Paenibacillus baekrokdamisoli]MBB3071866.1 AcrR family transcriptional regulator [Paenibacillus baekrokdamisoli]BBH24153.1 TetR family transcriptional regulator [Paenibacillus baekrokdamisoli]
MQTYELILNTAYSLFARNGYEKTSLSMIAKEVGISKPAIYYYFSSKEVLFYALLQAVCDEIRFEKFFSITQFSATNFADQLVQCGLTMIQDQRDDPNYSLLMKEFMIQSTRDEKILVSVKTVIESYLNGFEALLQHGVSLGVLTGENLRVKAEMLTLVIDQIDNYMSLSIGFDYEGLWRHCVSQTLQGARS